MPWSLLASYGCFIWHQKPFAGLQSMMHVSQKRKSSSPEPELVLPKFCKTTSAPNVSTGGRLGRTSTSSPKKRKDYQMTIPDEVLTRRPKARLKLRAVASDLLENVEERRPSPSSPNSPSEAEEDTELGLVITFDEEDCKVPQLTKRKSNSTRNRPSGDGQEEENSLLGKWSDDSSCDSEMDEFGQLDVDLERKSQQHNLTSVNIRTILHEVITNEHVVAMMKAAIRETQDLPLFEPKMTRSRLKEVVEKGVGSSTWNKSTIERVLEIKPPQFVDIPLEDDEDSSDEEYCPGEDEEDETPEEMFLSDVDSTASSPRCPRGVRPRTPGHSECEEDRLDSPRQIPRQSRHLRVEAVPMGPPPPPSSTGLSRPLRAQDCTFMEKLHAVDEELELSSICTGPYQPLAGSAGSSLVACRTRSKRPLRNVPLGKLEAELCAPDITPDMYDDSLALEDRDWSLWLQGLMTTDMENEEEVDDDDDPEYNFLEDLDEPDREDYRNDRAVRITKKEVNGLLEELFETFQDDELVVNGRDHESREEDEEREEEEEEAASPPSAPQFNIPQAIRFEEPLANMLTERRRTVREQLEAQQQRRSLQETSGRSALLTSGSSSTMLLPPLACPALTLDHAQKLQLQQQIQQHVQLLTQVHLLSSAVEVLDQEAHTTKQYLEELQSFARRQEATRSPWEPGFRSIFRACNLPGALSLIQEQMRSVSSAPPRPPARPQTCSSNVRTYPLLPAETAWLFATRSVFLYPELLPLCSLDPVLHSTRTKNNYTRGEDRLIILGLKHFSQTEFPYRLMCRYLIRTKKQDQLRSRVKELCASKTSDNVIKLYCKYNIVPAVEETCRRVLPGEERPPVEREVSVMPNWLRKSQPIIYRTVTEYNGKPHGTEACTNPVPLSEPPYTFPGGTQYLPSLPRNVNLRLHPCMNYKREQPPIAPKPFRIYAFSCSNPLAPITKAPPDTRGFLAQVTQPNPSQGVILLATAPSTPVHGALPLSRASVTPAHGAVPLVHLSPSAPMGAPIFGQGLVTACVMQTSTNQTERTLFRAPPRKLLPKQSDSLKPSPPNPALPVEKTGPLSSVTRSARRTQAALRLSKRPPRSAPTHRETQAKARAALNRTLTRPLLPAPPSLEAAEVKDDTYVRYSQHLSGCVPNAAEGNAFPVPYGDSRATMFPADIPSLSERHNDQYVLLQAAAQDPTHMVWVPKQCLVPSGSVSSNSSGFDQSEGHPFPSPHRSVTEVMSGVSSCRSPPSTLADGSLGYRHAPGSSLEEQLHRLVEGLREEGGADEEEGLGDVEGPFLTLSESSSGSLCSSLESPAEVLERMVVGEEEEEELGREDGERTEVGLDRWCLASMHRPVTPAEETSGGKYVGGAEEEKAGGEKGDCCVSGVVVLSGRTVAQEQTGGAKNEGKQDNQRNGGGEERNGGGEERNGAGERNGGGEERNGAGERNGGGEERNGAGERNGEQERDGKERGEGEGGQNGAEKDGDGEKDRDREQGEEEEEEDFDDLTQDEDDEEVMSSASEESVLSVPELQETMKKLTWLASERRLCDSEEDNSPNSPTSPNSPVSQNSQEENSEEEEGPTKGEELEASEGGVSKVPGDDDIPSGESNPRANGKGSGRGRGRGRPTPRSLRRSRRQERDSKDTSKLLLLYDDHILDNDPLRESKDMAFAQAYLNRVRETLQDIPGKVEEFLVLLYEFEQGDEGRNAVELYSQLRLVLGEWPDLLRDFAAFLLPEQALECGLFEEQQAFERSRRFLRQLEISFGENPSHYQKIVRALQGGPGLSPASIEELKSQMSSLLKGHTHLQGEFWVFFEELRPPLSRPGQFEEACWPEESGAGVDSGEGVGLGSGGGASDGFEEVTLPDLEEEDIPPMTSRRRRSKIGSHGYKECDWPEKDCSFLCHEANHDAKLRRHKRKGCSHCHGNKASEGVSRVMKTLEPLYPRAASPPVELLTETCREESEEKEEHKEEKEAEPKVEDEVDSGANVPHPEQTVSSWDVPEEDSVHIPEDRDEEEDGEMEEDEHVWKDGENQNSLMPKKSNDEEEERSGLSDVPSASLSGEVGSPLTPLQPRPSPPSDPPVCAKNISLTASGEKVILWTREADRVILTTCQQQGANQTTFQEISVLLGNKTTNEVSRRFRDLMRLFHTAARQVNSEDEAVVSDQQTVTGEEQD
ncbi:hypothetical protein DPEC_G00353550 [Dallia pectoralis]|uniref:Uncharacterized protein n=1 Tax=Dallia pectoralis TaxID=75939 RepID=A0ACC2F2R3_DALPE|nr:hypothetical protein DPEC_G00353550 [Dallia pectoralis]